MEEEKSKNQEETVEEMKNKSSFIDAWVNAFNGIIYATTTQGNIRKQLLSAVTSTEAFHLLKTNLTATTTTTTVIVVVIITT